VSATREVVMRWRGPIAEFLQDETPEIDLEGALSSGKTTACLWKVFNSLHDKPGIHWWMGRYGDGETQTKVRPAFEQVCQEAGSVPAWNAKELSYDFPNGSKCFAYGLKSPDALSRYSKMRGMGVAGIYNDQTEELPEDFSLELRLRLRQPNFPHQLIFSPNPPNVTHWLAQQFPADNSLLPKRRYYAISIHHNAHNLPKELLEAALMAYPPTHAKHRSVIQGLRGMNVSGDPVYKGAFDRQAHEIPVAYDRELPLYVALDFGKHHPCLVVKQVSATGQARFLAGILGQQLYLDDFITIGRQYLGEWFPNARIEWCCDPAGATDTSHGTAGAVKTLRDQGINPRYVMDSNSPAVRLAMIERMAMQMRRRDLARSEALVVSSDPEKWLTISAKATVPDKFLADAFEAGYVWDEHMVSVGNKQVRKPKKDGWYEHGMNCAEYLEVNFGSEPPKVKTGINRSSYVSYHGTVGAFQGI
jgi:hypothetical protein